jgi:hypothetical protein
VEFNQKPLIGFLARQNLAQWNKAQKSLQKPLLIHLFDNRNGAPADGFLCRPNHSILLFYSKPPSTAITCPVM